MLMEDKMWHKDRNHCYIKLCRKKLGRKLVSQNAISSFYHFRQTLWLPTINKNFARFRLMKTLHVKFQGKNKRKMFRNTALRQTKKKKKKLR